MTETAPHFLRVTRGTSRSGEQACVAYAGVAEGLTYLAPFVEERLFEHHEPPRTQPVDLDAMEASLFAEADLVVLAATPEVLGRLRRGHDVSAVPRIHQVVDTRGALGDVHRAMSSREVKRLAAAKAAGFRYDVTHEDRHFFEFYDAMHRPTMEARYGDKARSVEREKALETLFRQGALFRVFRGETWVAGSVGQIDVQRRTLNSRLIGIAGGDAGLREAGAQNFVYHAILDWACLEASIDHVDFQGCEPFLTKGTFQYKKRFGTRAVIPANVFGTLRMALRPNRLTRSVRDFLAGNPVLDADGNGALQAKYFHDRERPVRGDIPFASPGIGDMVAIDLDAWPVPAGAAE